LIKFVFGLLASAAILQAPSASAQPAAVYDLILRGGTVFDGTGGNGRAADVGIIGDRIIAVGDLRRARGREERDVRATCRLVSSASTTIRSRMCTPGPRGC
jgi:N-acyl-D-amino-acid deacylase